MNEPRASKNDELAKTIANRIVDDAALHGAFVATPGRSIQPPRQPAERTLELTRRTGLELGGVLGQGGMGVVRLARQLALDRDVAVKTVRPEVKSELVTRMLLQEALILGRLEHPNILPIYDICHEAGEPRIVLKKVEGTEWSQLMHHGNVIRAEFAVSDPLEWNLGVLMQVCNAVHFAHSRGVVHRDLKPDNIMVGKFGELYVMDWGLAVCTEDDGTGRFPLASNATELAGTPQYMAPEMLGGPVSQISARTDIYLLGAMLYEIIAGAAPHRGRNIQEIILQVVTSQPEIPAASPSELSRICRRAMAPEPELRFESADAMRLSLLGFLQHAGSRRLAELALARTAELLACLREPLPHASGLSERIQMLFGECRFGYRQALASWPENDLAIAGQERALRAMIDYELAQQNPRSAGTLLASLAVPDVALRARVDAAMAAFERSGQRMDELERFKKKLDLETGSRVRAIGAGVLGLIWTIAPAAGPLVRSRYPQTGRWPSIAFAAAVILALGVEAVRRRRDLRESNITRWLLRGAFVAMLGQIVLESAALALGIDPVATEVMWPLVWFCVSAMLAAIADVRLLPMTAGFLGALYIGTRRPELRFYAMNASNLVMTINMFSIWMPRRRAKPATP
ncbi:MAG: Serine/threonine protein kinase PrkC, regulator of stationary phase [Myxococcaceae bacterium]|nr:Serine/threonine protein kinase PrkC, regulator of stationary phase [Myxococcaceae bacterium]